MAHEQDCKIHSPQRFDDSPAIGKSLADYSDSEIKAEILRRKNARKKAHTNARTNKKIAALEFEIKKLKKELV